MNTIDQIGKRVAAYRARQNISQQSFAQRCSISMRYLSRLENGDANPSFHVLERISSAMDITIVELIEG